MSLSADTSVDLLTHCGTTTVERVVREEQAVLRVVYERCCGLDIHKKVVVACLLRTNSDGSVGKDSRSYSTVTRDLLALCDWLWEEEQCTHAVMERTASFWRPIDNLLEGQIELLVLNAFHTNAVPRE